MTTTIRDAQALTYLATRLREETHGCAKWDQNGTYAVIAELIGQNFGETIHRVIGHAMDPEARTPGAIRRPFVPARVEEPGRRQPARAGEDCRLHPGEYVGSCRACAVDHLDHPEDPVVDDPTHTAGKRLLAEIRARRLGPQTSPAPDVASEPAVDEAAAGLGAQSQDVQQRAGEPDRPETACATDGCFRPTRDGVCDRCRESQIAADVKAGNDDLIERLKAQQRQRPVQEPIAPTRFTSADINYDRVHAAQARAAEQRSTR